MLNTHFTGNQPLSDFFFSGKIHELQDKNDQLIKEKETESFEVTEAQKEKEKLEKHEDNFSTDDISDIFDILEGEIPEL